MKVYYIPNGPVNIQTLFPGINFRNVAEYYLEIQDNTATQIATTPINELSGGCCCDDKMRIHFLNYLGTIDCVNFKIITNEHEAKSSSSRRSVTYPLVRRTHAVNRTDVKANDTYTLSTYDYGEKDMAWLDELIDSPLAFAEWGGTQGQAPDYIPVIIQDTKKITLKQDDKWSYEVIIQVKLSHDRIIIRN